MAVEIELRRDEIHLGDMGAITGKAPLARVFDQSSPQLPRSLALLRVIPVENDGARVDEAARGSAGQAAIMLEAFRMEELRAPAVKRKKVGAQHGYQERAFDMGAPPAKPIERHQIDARNTGGRAMLGRDFVARAIGLDGEFGAVD